MYVYYIYQRNHFFLNKKTFLFLTVWLFCKKNVGAIGEDIHPFLMDLPFGKEQGRLYPIENELLESKIYIQTLE